MTWFIDGGAHRGESIRLARQTYGDPLQIIALEPQAECWPLLATTGALIIPAALWTTAERSWFYRGAHSVSASLMADKINILTERGEMVPTIMLGSILSALPDGEHVHLKLDIEGAEYDVLEQAIEARDLRWVRDLYVDFHADRIAGFPVARHNALVERLLAMGFALPKWNPIDMTITPMGERWFLR